jgi:DNA-binding response OmpR family regulator
MVTSRGSLLLVHEDQDVARLVSEMLTQYGFAVEHATTMAAVQQQLDAGGVGAIVLGWETELGRRVHRWVSELHRALVPRCILLVEGTPDEALARVYRTCRLDDLAGLLDAAVSIVGDGRPRLLLVDDDPSLLGEMAVLLELIGFDVITASDGSAALDLLQHTVFDVVLSDWQMPGVHGVQVYRWIAQHRPALLRKLVFMTGGDLDDVRDGDVRPIAVPKGMDSPTLLGYLHAAAGTSSRFAQGTPRVDVSRVAVLSPEPRAVAPKRPVELPEDDGIPITIMLG